MTIADGTRPPRLAILLWCSLFALHRTAVVLYGFDAVYFWEECYRALAAAAIGGGWPLSLFDLQADPYAGGSLVLALLYAPLAALSTPSVVALKLVSVAWHGAGLALWIAVVARWLSLRAAHAFGALYVLGPPLLATYDAIALGSHPETLTTSALQTFLCLRLLDERRGAKDYLLWGAAAGLSIWFTYVSALTLAVGAAYLAVAGRLELRRWPAVAVGLALGAAPWLAYNASHDFAGFAVLSRTFSAGAGAEGSALLWYAGRLYHLLAYGLPSAMMFGGAAAPVRGAAALLDYGYLSVVAAAWCLAVAEPAAELVRSARERGRQGLAEAARARPELAILPVAALLLALLAASEHTLQPLPLAPMLPFRVVVPALPALLVAMAVLATGLHPRAVRATLFGAALLAGTVGAMQTATAGSRTLLRTDAATLATGAEAFGHLLVYNRGERVDEMAARIAALEPELRRPAWAGVGYALAHYFADRPAIPVRDAMDVVCRADPAHRYDVIGGALVAFGAGRAQVRPVAKSRRAKALRRAFASELCESAPASE